MKKLALAGLIFGCGAYIGQAQTIKNAAAGEAKIAAARQVVAKIKAGTATQADKDDLLLYLASLLISQI